MVKKNFLLEKFGLLLAVFTTIALTGCSTLSPVQLSLGDNIKPEFFKALPAMGFPSAIEKGFKGRGVYIAVLDLFSGPDEAGMHGWAVVETIERAVPDATVTRVDLLLEDAENPLAAFNAAQTLARLLDESIRPDIVNLSLTWWRRSCDYGDHGASLMKTVIDQLSAAGTVVVAASGNNGGGHEAGFPACLPNVVGVGSVYDYVDFEQTWPGNPDKRREDCTDSPVLKGMPICFSNLADVYAPGSVTGLMRSPQEIFQGTSASAPLVSASIAAVMSMGYDPFEALGRIYQTLDVSFDAPKIDLEKALSLPL